MPLKALIVVVLRMYTIYLIVEGISQIALVLPFYWKITGQIDNPDQSLIFPVVLSAIGYLLVAAILWFCSFRVGSAVTRRLDTDISLTQITREDLYAFGFVFLGTWFVLSSTFSVVQSVYNFARLDFSLPEGSERKGYYLAPMLGYLLKITFAFFCVFKAKLWAQKLVRFGDSNRTSTDL
jgi:hypothetical protein